MKDLEGLAGFVLSAEQAAGRVTLALEMTRPVRIHQLNRRFRGVDRPTDVIAFRSEVEPLSRPECRERGFQGDIAINVSQAARQAKAMGHSLKREIRTLWIHGILHLMGYTDYAPVPRRRMFQRQNDLLRRWEKKNQ